MHNFGGGRSDLFNSGGGGQKVEGWTLDEAMQPHHPFQKSWARPWLELVVFGLHFPTVQCDPLLNVQYDYLLYSMSNYLLYSVIQYLSNKL